MYWFIMYGILCLHHSALLFPNSWLRLRQITRTTMDPLTTWVAWKDGPHTRGHYMCLLPVQAVDLSEEMLALRQVDYVDIAVDQLSSGEYDEKQVMFSAVDPLHAWAYCIVTVTHRLCVQFILLICRQQITPRTLIVIISSQLCIDAFGLQNPIDTSKTVSNYYIEQ